MYDPSPIEIVAPAPALRFSSPEQAVAYYQVHGVKTRQDLIILAELISAELKKVNNIFSEIVRKMESDSDMRNDREA